MIQPFWRVFSVSRYTLGQKLSLTICGVVICVAVLIGLLAVRTTKGLIEAELKTQGSMMALHLSHQSEPLILNHELWELYKAVKGTARASARMSPSGNVVAYAMVLSDEGEILAHSHPGRFRLGDVLDVGPVNEAALKATDLLIQPTTALGEPAYDFAQPVVLDHRKIGVVRIGITQRLMLQALADQRNQIALVTAGLACAGVLLGLWLSRRMTGPLVQLSRNARAIADGQLADAGKVPTKEKDEIGILADSFNSMAEALREKVGELHRTNEYLEHLLEIANDFIYILDREGRITYINSKFSEWGYSKADLIGQPFAVILDSDHRGLRTEQTLTEGVSQQYEAAVKDKYGHIKSVILSTTGLRTQAGEPNGLIGIAKDVTLMKEMESHLFEAEKLSSIGNIMVSLVHEISNPLGIIHGFVQELLIETRPDCSQYQLGRILEEEVMRCQRIVASFLEFARPGAQQMAPTNPSPLLEKSVNLVSPICKKQKVEVYLDLPTNLPEIDADDSQILQLLINFYLNALEAMPRGGELRVAAASESSNGEGASHLQPGGPVQQLKISISDTGRGIAPEDLPYIFEPFFSKKSTGEEGIGMGLFVNRQFVVAHGGRIEVQSVQGKGTTCLVWLPVRRPELGNALVG